MAHATITVRKLTPAIGAEISGVDLGGPLGNSQVSELHDALMAHHVIFFRDQEMSVEQHKAFGRLFGELLVHPAARAELEGHPEIRVVHADEKTRVATGEVWHSDMSCEPGAADGLDPLPAPQPAERQAIRPSPTCIWPTRRCCRNRSESCARG